LDQVGDCGFAALVRDQLDVTAVVEDLHPRRLQLLSEPAQYSRKSERDTPVASASSATAA
jgi:hypothetical protein